MRRLVLLPLLVPLLAGCPHRIDFGGYGRLEDPHFILEELARRYELVTGLVGEGKVAVDTPDVDGTLRMAVEIAEPGFIYLETIDPLGNPRGTFATAGESFEFYDPHRNVFYIGPADPEVIGSFLPVALAPEEMVAAMLGELPLLFGAEEARLELDDAAGIYLLYLRQGGVRQRVEVATRDLRLISVQTRGRKAIDGSFADHEELLPGIPFPTTVVLKARDAEVTFRYTDVRLNPESRPESFDLQPPPGTPVDMISK